MCACAPAALLALPIELLPDAEVPEVPEVEPAVLPGLAALLELVSPALELDEPYELALSDPIAALVRVQLPLEPCRHPVRVMLPDFALLLWSHVEPDVPEVPVVLPDCPLVLPDCPLVLLGSLELPDCEPLVDPDWAARLTAKAHAIARLDAVVTTRFMS